MPDIQKAHGGYHDNGGMWLSLGIARQELPHIYMHEYMHAVDRKRKFSSQPDWQEAWKSEIYNNKDWVWQNSRKMRQKVSADFGRLLLNNNLDAIAKKFPKCVAFIKDRVTPNA